MKKYTDLSAMVRLTIVSETSTQPHEGSLGKGVVQLLEGIQESGSLNKAAKSLAMAYSKAWRIVRETEAGFGFPLIIRDGARGSTLTADGEKLVSAYQQVQDEATEFANKRLSELLG